ncbi:MAG: sporulation transcription factor Spo0A [Clostridia bacterium]|nr:sporulation transcription factor Spo0A [Clostridia bacterium]
MPKKTVYLLQDTEEVNQALKNDFTMDGEYQVIGTATDGIKAVAEILDKRPDVVVTELVVAGYDGLCVINKVKEANKNQKIIVLSYLCGEEIVGKAMTLGANYFLAKPYSFDVLKQRIGETLEASNKTVKSETGYSLHKISLEEKISKIFINVGIPPHIKGYSFLREGVKMAVEDPAVINNITKKLYPSIGEKYQTTASKVERAIRHAIEVAWNRGRIETINNILGVRAYVGAEKPTNGEFIALVADKMLLEQG